jgi:hypothetical protein
MSRLSIIRTWKGPTRSVRSNDWFDIMKRLNPKWTEEMRRRIDAGSVDETLSAHMAAQWLIVELSNSNRAFKVFNLGGGVKRITTETDTCPCCKRPLSNASDDRRMPPKGEL